MLSVWGEYVGKHIRGAIAVCSPMLLASPPPLEGAHGRPDCPWQVVALTLLGSPLLPLASASGPMSSCGVKGPSRGPFLCDVGENDKDRIVTCCPQEIGRSCATAGQCGRGAVGR